MRRIVISEFITLDGVIEAPGGEKGHPHTGWSFDFLSEEYLKYKLDEIFEAGALLLGRKTYEGFAKAWPGRTDEMGFAERMNTLPKYVVSKSLDKAEWNNTTIIKNNVVSEILKLKQQNGGDILVHGSGTLANTLIKNDLADEIRLMIHPVTIGGGMRLFKEGPDKKTFKLKETRTFKNGTLVLVYEPGNK
jgi:dihydrofolate reductase